MVNQIKYLLIIFRISSFLGAGVLSVLSLSYKEFQAQECWVFFSVIQWVSGSVLLSVLSLSYNEFQDQCGWAFFLCYTMSFRRRSAERFFLLYNEFQARWCWAFCLCYTMSFWSTTSHFIHVNIQGKNVVFVDFLSVS